jgi:hypothetical protein
MSCVNRDAGAVTVCRAGDMYCSNTNRPRVAQRPGARPKRDITAMSSSNPENSRSSAEVEHLNKLETIVQRGLDAHLEAGHALAEISDTWLYRATHPTFEAYLRERWAMSRSRGGQLIQAAETAAPVRRDGTDGLAIVWEQARQEFGSDDVSAIDIHVTVHKRDQPTQLTPDPSPGAQPPAEVEAGDLLRRLRWLMTESSGTMANIAHQLETRAAELDEDTCDQLRDDVLVLEEDITTLKALLAAPVDWDAEHGRLIAGEVPPFEDDSEDDDEDD